jgi:hypothetical protein
MRLLERFENVKQVWGLALPTIPLPPNDTILGWLAQSTDDEFENALLRIPHRMRQGKLGQAGTPPTEIHKLVSSFLYEMRKTRRQKEQQAEGRAAALARKSQVQPTDEQTADIRSYDGRGGL